jgi:hypothetical protein
VRLLAGQLSDRAADCHRGPHGLRVHPLRGADSLQLAAAVIASEGLPASLNIVTLDERLAGAARREGFIVQAVDPVVA